MKGEEGRRREWLSGDWRVVCEGARGERVGEGRTLSGNQRVVCEEGGGGEG